MRDALVSMVQAWQTALGRAVRMAISEGHLRPETDVQQLLFDVHGLILALHHDARVLRNPGSVARARTAFERVIAHYLGVGRRRRRNAQPRTAFERVIAHYLAPTVAPTPGRKRAHPTTSLSVRFQE